MCACLFTISSIRATFPDLELSSSQACLQQWPFPLRSSLSLLYSFHLSLFPSFPSLLRYHFLSRAAQLRHKLIEAKVTARQTKRQSSQRCQAMHHTLNNGLNAHFPQHEPCNAKNFMNIDCVVGRHKAVPSVSRWYLCRSYCFISVGRDKW